METVFSQEMSILYSECSARWKYYYNKYSPQCGGVEHHHGGVLCHGVGGVVLHPPQQLLDQRMPGVDLQGFLLVEVVVSLHVLGLGVGLRLDDLLHVSGPAKPARKEINI